MSLLRALEINDASTHIFLLSNLTTSQLAALFAGMGQEIRPYNIAADSS